MNAGWKDRMRAELASLGIRDIISHFSGKKPFSGRGRGASAEEIGTLERAAQIPLPADYRVFLELFGKDTGGLFPAEGVAYGRDAKGNSTESRYPLRYGFTIDEIMPLYRGNRRRRRLEKLKKGMLLIGVQHHSEDGGCYYIDCGSAGNPVVNVDAYGDVTEISPSFKDFLLDYGFLKKGRF